MQIRKVGKTAMLHLLKLVAESSGVPQAALPCTCAGRDVYLRAALAGHHLALMYVKAADVCTSESLTSTHAVLCCLQGQRRSGLSRR